LITLKRAKVRKTKAVVNENQRAQAKE